jgi:hypothetical protein
MPTNKINRSVSRSELVTVAEREAAHTEALATNAVPVCVLLPVLPSERDYDHAEALAMNVDEAEPIDDFDRSYETNSKDLDHAEALAINARLDYAPTPPPTEAEWERHENTDYYGTYADDGPQPRDLAEDSYREDDATLIYCPRCDTSRTIVDLIPFGTRSSGYVLACGDRVLTVDRDI